MVKKNICQDQTFSPCPCKTVDLDNDISYCDFVNMFGESLIADNANNSKKADALLRKICPEVRNEILHHGYRAEQLQKRRKEFLEDVKPGDVVFCESHFHNVIFLEPPSTSYGYVKYKTIDGEIFEAPGSCFRCLSNGTK